MHPPRLDGKKVGVFACRSPHRPNPIGLTLARLTSVSSNKLFVSGIDLIDHTPILDIKPYIPNYDNPIITQASTLTREATEEPCKVTTDDNKSLASNSLKAPRSENFISTTFKDSNEHLTAQWRITPIEGIRTANWLNNPPANPLEVQISEEAQQQLSMLQHATDDVMNTKGHVDSLCSVSAIKQALIHILQEDPRSVYRRNKCSKDPYRMSIDNLDITCFFEELTVKVISIEPKHKTDK